VKKILFAAVLTVLLVAGCDTTELYTVSITNESSKTVSYVYNDSSDILAEQETKIYEVKAHTQPPKNYVDQNGIASVSIKYDNMTGDYTFIEADYYNLIIKNEFPFDVTITAGNFIDNGGSKSLTVNTGTTNTSAKIYTKHPTFMSTLSYPVIFEWNINGNEMSVTIR
jgi:hypothetical protein